MSEAPDNNLHEYVTALIGGQLFGLPILRVQDVFAPERLTRVPLAPGEIAPDEAHPDPETEKAKEAKKAKGRRRH